MSLNGEIRTLAPELAAAAQKELDDWVQDEDGVDVEFGAGGVCDAISRRLADVIATHIEAVEIADGGWEGDDHAYLLCTRGAESVVVDLPPHLYEVGGGYSWRKIEGVRLTAQDVLIEDIEIPLTLQ
jgi:hypothetical protein